MAHAYGFNATLLFAFESVYGTAPSSGAYYKLPFITADLSGEQPLEEDDVLGLGRDPQDPTYDILRVGGQIVVPLDVRNIGFWLKLLLAAPGTAGSGTYTHTFASGGETLPSAAIQIGYPQTGVFFMYTGCVASSMQLGVGRSGKLQATFQILGQDETKRNYTIDSDPNTKTLTRFHKFQGNIQRNGSDLASIMSADLTYNNNPESVDTIRDDELVEGIDPGKATLAGNITARFAATTLYDDAAAQSAIDVDMIYTISASQKLTVAAQSVFLPKSKRSISGPGGVEATYAWQGSEDSVEGEALEVVLINDVANYNNAA